jgi:hypothetical protein
VNTKIRDYNRNAAMEMRDDALFISPVAEWASPKDTPKHGQQVKKNIA